MAKKSKGPPYPDDPDYDYVVIDNPWAMRTTPKDRRQRDFDILGWWLKILLQYEVEIEAMYRRDTDSHVIVKLVKSDRIDSIVGEIAWPAFLTQLERGDQQQASRVYRYNYRNNGDPATHQWTEEYPTSQPPIRGFPVKTLDVPPGNAPRPTHRKLADLVLLPPPRPTPPEVKHEDIKVEKIDKADPYEAEATAVSSLRSPAPQGTGPRRATSASQEAPNEGRASTNPATPTPETHAAHTKEESDDGGPSTEFSKAVNDYITLQSNSSRVKPEQDDPYEPSPEFQKAIKSFNGRTTLVSPPPAELQKGQFANSPTQFSTHSRQSPPTDPRLSRDPRIRALAEKRTKGTEGDDRGPAKKIKPE